MLLLLALAFFVGVAVLVTVVGRARHLREVLPNALVNVTLTHVFFGLLFQGIASFWLVALYPGVLSVVVAASSAAYAARLVRASEPPKYIPLYPTKALSVALVAGILVIGLQRVWVWREGAEGQARAFVNPNTVLEIAARSLNAREYMAIYFAKGQRKTIVDEHLIHVCGTVIRLAESDWVSLDGSLPTVKICRTSITYSKDLGVP